MSNSLELKAFLLQYDLWQDIFRINGCDKSRTTQSNLAASVQCWIENRVKSLVSSWIINEKIDNANISLSGGVFSNVLINSQLRELHNVKQIFVQPAMGDAGCSMGAALCLEERLNPKDLPYQNNFNCFLGPSFNKDFIKNEIDLSNFNYLEFHSKESFAAFVAFLIFNRYIIGYFEGSMEWGPRALCNRSIFANADNFNINVSLNNRLKRTEFMPFAPVMTESEAIKLLGSDSINDSTTRFMTSTYLVKQDYQTKIAAAINIDGTSRPQIINENLNHLVFLILKYYGDLSGIESFINTSFNGHEEPIVCTPKDAINSLFNNQIDYLAIWPFVVGSDINKLYKVFLNSKDKN